MLLLASTIFLSAFLLFLVQPLVARQILPWFGGSAAVWTTCLVFFQSVLVVGYAYADLTTRRWAPRRQALFHCGLLALSVATLPISLNAGLRPAGGDNPGLGVLAVLTATVGLPFFVLSTTGPLVQTWYARTYAAGQPYRLFALSNLASLAALLGYPVFIEPWTTTASQVFAWSWAYAAFAGLCAIAAWRHGAASPAARSNDVSHGGDRGGIPPGLRDRALWIALPAVASLLLSAVTNHVCQDIAAVPLLWVVPLGLYLASFILCFEGRAWYRRSVFLPLLAVVLAAMSFGLTAKWPLFTVAVPLYILGLFVCCMFCHGELAAIRPAPRHLTSFYVMVALGGAVGAFLVGMVAPYVLPAYYEVGIGLVLCGALAMLLTWRMGFVLRLLMALVLAGTIAGTVQQVMKTSAGFQLVTRNFYGVLRLGSLGSAAEPHLARTLHHGGILHGLQLTAPDRRALPTAYYGPDSGIGLALEHLRPGARRVGVIGLGVGTLAAYGRDGDSFRFYEINPTVIELARGQFSYLADTRAQFDVVLGDARLSLERESPQQFDVLAVDAFSGDAVPVHLLTVEALDIYARHLRPDGVIAYHVTNVYLSLAPVIRMVAESRGYRAVLVRNTISDHRDPMRWRLADSDWVLVTRNEAFLAGKPLARSIWHIEAVPGVEAWTDDRHNLFRVLRH